MKKILLITVLLAMLLSACSLSELARQDTTSDGTNENTLQAGSASNDTAGNANGQSGSTTPEASAETVANYFPFTADTNMVYKGTGNEYAAYETYVDYIRGDKTQIRKNNGGTEAVLVYSVRDGKLALTYSKGEVYYKYDFTSLSDGEDILLMEPIAVGTAWTAKDGSPRSITSVNAQVDTPSGKYTAVEVTTKEKDSTDTEYYVKGIGLVKSVYTSGDASMSVTSELEKVESNVSYGRSINCYYPQFEKDRIVYMEREIEIKTNEEMKWKFQKELKTIPEDGGLTKTLTKNTQILGIQVDEEKGTVTVDLSSDFVKEMNAGTSLESMLLESITNTFGDYYMKGKVIITIDGKPYESGHVLMKEGEAFNVNTLGVAQYK
jgi:hypothetical protein